VLYRTLAFYSVFKTIRLVVGTRMSKDHFFKARNYTWLHFVGIGVNHLVISFVQKFPRVYTKFVGRLDQNKRIPSQYDPIISSKDLYFKSIINLINWSKRKKYNS
jgi:hypothetical protein